MRITHLYADPQGETHFKDLEIELPDITPSGALSPRIPVTSLYFRRTEPDYGLDWHNAPRRQYIVNLDGAVEITASDGERRIIGPGEVFLVEDVTGKGHLSQAVNGRLRHSLYIAVE